MKEGSPTTQEAIDKEIAVHEAALRKLRTRRNTLAPISKIPAELLAEIFILAKPLDTPYPEDLEKHYRDIDEIRGWLNVACVCQNWRNVALNAARMWNRLDLCSIKDLEWAAKVLARSQHAPLHVKCSDSERDWTVLSAILAHMDRIEHLEIDSVATDDSIVLSRIMAMIGLNDALDSLQSLRLRKLAGLYNATHSVHDGIHRFFSAIQMPYLQTLDVEGFTLPPTTPVLPQLRQLTYEPPPQANSSLAAMLSILRSMPSLERLEIGSALQTPDAAIEEGSNVELPKLTHIVYNTTHFKGSSLFRHIHYPSSARVKFTSQLSYDHVHGTLCIDDLKAIMLHMGDNDGAASVHSNTVVIHDLDGAHFHMRVSNQDVRVLELKIPTASEDTLPLFRLSVMFPRSQAQTFRLCGFSSVKEGDWASLFRQHEYVQSLEAEEVNLACIRALFKPSDADQPPFPRLKTLQLGNCDIITSATSLVRVLEERRLLGTPIDSLQIFECWVTKDIIGQLDKYVQVEWDGVQKFNDDDDDDDYDDYDEDDDENDSDNYSVTWSDLMVG